MVAATEPVSCSNLDFQAAREHGLQEPLCLLIYSCSDKAEGIDEAVRSGRYGPFLRGEHLRHVEVWLDRLKALELLDDKFGGHADEVWPLGADLFWSLCVFDGVLRYAVCRSTGRRLHKGKLVGLQTPVGRPFYEEFSR